MEINSDDNFSFENLDRNEDIFIDNDKKANNSINDTIDIKNKYESLNNNQNVLINNYEEYIEKFNKLNLEIDNLCFKESLKETEKTVKRNLILIINHMIIMMIIKILLVKIKKLLEKEILNI